MKKLFNLPCSIGCVLLIFSSMSFQVYGTDSSVQEPLNVIHIMIDDLRSEGLTLYDRSGEISTPNLERLSKQGVKFTNSFANFATCGASRASIFTGLRPTETRFTNYATRIDEDAKGVLTLPHYLKGKGYNTVSLGKIFHARGDSSDAWSEPAFDPKLSPENKSSYFDYQDPANLEDYLTSCKQRGICNVVGKNKGVPFENIDVPDDAYFDGKIASKAIEKLEKFKSSKQPFYLAVGFNKPHLPFNAPKKYWDIYERDNIKMSPAPGKPIDAPIQAWHPSGELREWYAGIPDVPEPWVQNIPDDLSRTLRHGYYASTSYTDAMVGRVLDAVNKLGFNENTIIVLTSDHGFSLADHTLWNKHSLFSFAMKAPMIIKAPNIAKNESVAGVVEYVDIYPTIVDLLGLNLPSHLEGTSLVKNLKDTKMQTKDAVFVRYKDGESIHVNGYSYTAWFEKGERVAHMLYNNELDPYETVNLAGKDDYSCVVDDLYSQLVEHIKIRNHRAKKLTKSL